VSGSCCYFVLEIYAEMTLCGQKSKKNVDMDFDEILRKDSLLKK